MLSKSFAVTAALCLLLFIAFILSGTPVWGLSHTESIDSVTKLHKIPWKLVWSVADDSDSERSSFVFFGFPRRDSDGIWSAAGASPRIVLLQPNDVLLTARTVSIRLNSQETTAIDRVAISLVPNSSDINTRQLLNASGDSWSGIVGQKSRFWFDYRASSTGTIFAIAVVRSGRDWSMYEYCVVQDQIAVPLAKYTYRQ